MKVVVSEPVFGVTLTPSSVTATNTVTTIAPVIQHFTFGAGLSGKIYSYTASITNPQYFGVTALSTNVSNLSLTPDNATYSDLLYTTFTPPRVNGVGDTVGVYTATLTVTFLPMDFYQTAVTYRIPIKYDVNIANHNIGFWLSPKDDINAVMACSYDFVGGERYLTIGFGMGGDGIEPVLANREEDITENRTSTDSEGNTTSESVVVGKKKIKGSAVYASTATLGILGDPDRHLGIPLYMSARTDFCPFLQEYGSWIVANGGSGHDSQFEVAYKFNVPVGGQFTYELSSVGSTALSINDVQVSTWGNYRASTTGKITLAAGVNTVKIVSNASGTGQKDEDGEPILDAFGSFGVNIKDSNGNSWWSTKTPRRTAYKYWAEVYRFPIPMTGKGKGEILLSKGYAVKLNDFALGKTYGAWCGEKELEGSMFAIAHDGLGNVIVNINPWPAKERTKDPDLNKTLLYMVALPFYYSTLNNRITNLENPFKKFKTHFFMGFYNTGKVHTSEQPFPYVYEGPEGSGPGGKGKSKTWANLLTALAIGAATAYVLGATAVYFGVGAIAATYGVSAIAAGLISGPVGWAILAVAAVVAVVSFLSDACFTGDSLISMADGTFKPISEVNVGDMVFNRDKTSVNKVTFVEKTSADNFGYLFSISKDEKPFITINHPMYINGVLSSVYPEKTYEAYPWLGKTEQLIPDRVEKSKGEPVYNLWVTGDGTFIVNGYGTTSILGDGGWARLLVEQGIDTPDRLSEVLREMSLGGKDLAYGAYLCNKLFGKLDIKFINRTAGKVMANRKDTIARRGMKFMFRMIGKVAVYVTERKMRK
jgi:hypothetical protein